MNVLSSYFSVGIIMNEIKLLNAGVTNIPECTLMVVLEDGSTSVKTSS